MSGPQTERKEGQTEEEERNEKKTRTSSVSQTALRSVAGLLLAGSVDTDDDRSQHPNVASPWWEALKRVELPTQAST